LTPIFSAVIRSGKLDASRLGRTAAQRTFAELHITVSRARRYPGLPRFLLGHICYSDASNTLAVFMGIYATKEIGFTETQAQPLLLAGILAGLIGALGCGRAVDRVGPKRTLNALLILWTAAFALVVAIPLLDLPTALF